MKTSRILFMSIILHLVFLSGLWATKSAKDENPPDQIDTGYRLSDFSKWYFYVNVASPGTGIFFDQGKDAKADSLGNYSRPDFFSDGDFTKDVNLSVVGINVLYSVVPRKFRIGPILGVGIAKNKENSSLGSFVYFNGGLTVLAIDDLIRLECGYCLGLSAKESYTKNYDQAIYLGIAIDSKASDFVNKALSPKNNLNN